jgi:RimJ/RimL family protein N-acetyltransferase
MEFGGSPVGQVRYDLDNDKWLISFYIDEPFRGLGLGKTILKKTMFLQNKKHFIAFVKEDNLASNKTFISLNFKLILLKKIKERIFSEYHYELND